MDFVHVCSKQIEKGQNKGNYEVYPDFRVGRSRDLMVRGRAFHAIWDAEANLWSTDEYDVQRLVDAELDSEADRLEKEHGQRPKVKYLGSFGSNSWAQFRKFIQNISDNNHPLDATLTFANTEVKKSDYVSRRLPYPLLPGDYSAWDELVGTLYNTEERAKIEWAIGAVVSGDAKKIQKFLVLYGPAGTGKSTVLNIIQNLFARLCNDLRREGSGVELSSVRYGGVQDESPGSDPARWGPEQDRGQHEAQLDHLARRHADEREVQAGLHGPGECVFVHGYEPAGQDLRRQVRHYSATDRRSSDRSQDSGKPLPCPDVADRVSSLVPSRTTVSRYTARWARTTTTHIVRRR